LLKLRNGCGEKEKLPMVTAKQIWIGFVILFLVALLIVVAAVYWQHITGASFSHLLGVDPYPGIGQGC
jgi:uncharacterized membrane protein